MGKARPAWIRRFDALRIRKNNRWRRTAIGRVVLLASAWLLFANLAKQLTRLQPIFEESPRMMTKDFKDLLRAFNANAVKYVSKQRTSLSSHQN